VPINTQKTDNLPTVKGYLASSGCFYVFIRSVAFCVKNSNGLQRNGENFMHSFLAAHCVENSKFLSVWYFRDEPPSFVFKYCAYFRDVSQCS